MMQIRPVPITIECDTCPHVFEGSGDKLHMTRIGVFQRDLCSACKDKVVAYIMKLEQEKDATTSDTEGRV